MKISLVTPAFNEEDNIGLFYNTVRNVLKDYTVEIIFVNDGSKDNVVS